MSITLQRLHEFEQETPDRGLISIAIARHQAQVWPSPEVDAYARERSLLVHRLVDDLGIRIVSWGETDGAYPREVVEIIVPLAAALVPILGEMLIDWLKERPRKNKPSVPGIKIMRSDGAILEVTYVTREDKNKMTELVVDFLNAEDK